MKFINLFILFFISILATSCFHQECNCNDFKTGKFKFENTIDNKLNTSFFERNDSIQIENANGVIDTFDIRWTNDCEYILKNSKPKNIKEKKAVQMKILTTTKNSYTFEYNFVGETYKEKGTVIKL